MPGLAAESRLTKPVCPRMFVLLPQSRLRSMLHRGIQLLEARNRAHMEQLQQDSMAQLLGSPSSGALLVGEESLM